MADPPLKTALRNDLTTALKARDQVAASVIRMALTAITNAEVSGKASRDLTDDEVTAVLVREVKMRDEAAAAFRSDNREQSANEEEAQARVLRRYLPEPLTPEELHALVAQAVQQVQATGLQGGPAMGRVMALLKKPTAGRADGSAVADAVKRGLGLVP